MFHTRKYLTRNGVNYIYFNTKLIRLDEIRRFTPSTFAFLGNSA